MYLDAAGRDGLIVADNTRLPRPLAQSPEEYAAPTSRRLASSRQRRAARSPTMIIRFIIRDFYAAWPYLKAPIAILASINIVLSILLVIVSPAPLSWVAAACMVILSAKLIYQTRRDYYARRENAASTE